ncbi:hypothetical protein [Salinicola endophyticus]|uniref:Aminoglycoside phosphotransferase domain-containing protein n=1 Tax=Salinicola endophyticus TaxID=1949083 RepID=A0AB74U8H4_9GAMM
MSDLPPMADAELTRRVSLYAGVALTPLPLRFADSANWLWRSEELSPKLYKLARTDADGDPFWRGMRELFGVDRWRHAHELPALAGSLPQHLPLAPLPLTWLGRLQGAPLWSLPWRQAPAARMDIAFAGQLGRQLRRLHRDSLPGWGHPASGVYALDAWPRAARAFVAGHAALDAVELASLSWPLPSRAVWSLPDLRPDQFLLGGLDGYWADWEALVWAPLEFDLCLLELMLENAAQREAFVEAYGAEHLPSLDLHRAGMRAVILTLGVLGPQSTPLREYPHWL